MISEAVRECVGTRVNSIRVLLFGVEGDCMHYDLNLEFFFFHVQAGDCGPFDVHGK